MLFHGVFHFDSVFNLTTGRSADRTIKSKLTKSLTLIFGFAIFAILPPTMDHHSLAVAANSLESKILQRQARQFIDIVRKSKQFSDDLLINTYVVELAKKLARAADLDEDPLRYFVLLDSAPNAFAAPGATFFINTGLVDIVNNEAELVSVMAHEIAHFKQDHLKRLLKAHKATQTPSLLAVLAGIIIGGDAGIAAIAGAQAARIESVIDHTLSYEREADNVGLRIMADAGYDPKYAKNLMLALEKRIREAGVVQSNIHNTHPVTPERVASVDARLRQYSNLTFPQLSTEFDYFKARIQVLFDWEPNKTYSYFENKLSSENQSEQSVNRYGYALSLAKDGRIDEAKQHFVQLLSEQPDNLWVVTAAAELELIAGNTSATLSLLETKANAEDPHPAVIELYAKALLQSGNAEQAYRYVRKHLSSNPEHIQLLKIHAQVANQAGAAADGYLSDADYHFEIGDLKIALSQLKFAESNTNDFYIVSIAREKFRIVSEELAWRNTGN